MARADRDALGGLEVALAERPVVVRAAVLEGEVLAVAVVDPERELAGADDLHLARRELLDGADGQLRHGQCRFR